MMLVVGLKNAGLIAKQLASSVWQGIHEEPGIQGESFKPIGHVVHPTASGLAACRSGRIDTERPAPTAIIKQSSGSNMSRSGSIEAF